MAHSTAAAAMYLSYYGFSREPFQMAPDPAFLFLGSSHRKALDVIRRGVENRAGLVMITGADGLGKTTVIRSATQLLASCSVRSVVVLSPRLSYGELLRVIFSQLDLDYPEGEEQFELVRQLQQVFADERRRGRNVALFIDDAQDVPADTLESLRLLSDMEDGRDKLAQIILSGRHPDLERRFEAFDLRQLKQRIAYRATLVRLTTGESIQYIKHRVHCALGSGFEMPFSQASIEAIVRHCRGVPSQINIVCRGALAAGSGLGTRPIPPTVVARALADLEGGSPRPSWLKWTLAPAALLLLAAFIPYLRSTDDTASSVIEAQQTLPEGEKLHAVPMPVPIPPPAQEPAMPVPTEVTQRAVGSRSLDKQSDSFLPRDPQSGGNPSPVPIAHPPRPLPSSSDGMKPPNDNLVVAPPGGAPPPSARSDKKGTGVRTTAPSVVPSAARGQPEQRVSKSPPSASTIRQPQDRPRGASPASAESGKSNVSKASQSSQRGTTRKDKPQEGRSPSDPSGIVDWFIDKRSNQN